MIDVGDQLRAYFDAVDPSFGIEELMREPAAGPRPTPGGFRRRGLVVALGAALIALLVIGLPILLIGGGDPPAIDDPTTTLSPSTTLPATLDTPIVPMVESWQRVGAEVMNPAVGLFDMAATTMGLVAVGFDPGEDGRQNGAIFASADGVEWERFAEGDPALSLGAVLLYGVAEGPNGLVAVGMGCEDDAAPCLAYQTVWTSVDGVAWNRSAQDAEVFGESGALIDVLATDAGLYAVGSITESGEDEAYLSRPAVWFSADGDLWSRVWEGEPIDVGALSVIPGFHALTSGSDGDLVGVGAGLNSSGEAAAAVWRSVDGEAWERVDLDAPDLGLQTAMLDVTWGTNGFVAVGTEAGTEAALWQSPDGAAWSRLDTASLPFDTTGTLSAVAALETGYIAAGPHGFADQRGGWATLWTSPDGSSWDRVQTMGDGYAMALVVTEAGTAVAGGMPGIDNFYAAVWAGPNLDPVAPPPDPQPPVATRPGATEEDAPGIGVLDAGFTCEELVGGGFLYPAVVSYWVRFESPGELDPDDNGIPCEEAYAAEDVTAVYGPPEARSVRFEARHETGTFTAEGPAVDAGLVCPAGTIDYTEDPESGPSVLWRWEDLYTCDDGSGTLLLGVDEYIEDATGMWGVWNIVSGTGAYELLHGGGATDSVFGEYDASSGRLYVDD